MKKIEYFFIKLFKSRNMKKPSNAFQHYLKHWKNLSDEEKKPFLELEKRDKLIYAAEKRILEKKQEEEIKKLKMYIQITTSHVHCVGLDNGFKCFTIRGPIVRVVEFTDKELVDLEKKGYIKDRTYGNSVLKYKELILEDGGKFTFDKRAAKKFGIKTYGGSILNNYDGYVGEYTVYNNYKGERWESYGH